MDERFIGFLSKSDQIQNKKIDMYILISSQISFNEETEFFFDSKMLSCLKKQNSLLKVNIS